MKRVIVFILCISLLALSGCTQKYKRIHFGQNSLGQSAKEFFGQDTKVLGTPEAVFPAQIPIYEIRERKITNKELETMKQQLGISDSMPAMKIELLGNRLEGRLYGSADAPRSYLDMSDEELEKIAWEAFEKLPFMDGTFEYTGIVSETTLKDSEGTHTVSAGVSFRRKLDGIRVLGDERCVLKFDGDGLIGFTFELYEYKEIGQMDVVPLDDAFAKLKTPDRLVISSKEIMNSLSIGIDVVIDSMQLEETVPLLVNQHSGGCTILQPVYSFLGDATDTEGRETDFNCWVIAIPDEYTKD